MALKLVTDENVLRQLEGENQSSVKKLRPVTDEKLLRQLNEEPEEKPSFMKSLYKAIGIESQKNPLDFARDLAYGVAKGTAQGAEMVSQGGDRKGAELLGNAITGRPTPPRNEKFKYEDVARFIEPIKSQNPEDWQNRLAQGIGSYLPYGLAGGPSLLGQAAAGAAHGYATAEPNQQNIMFPPGKTGSAAESALLNSLIGGAGKLVNQFRPSVMFRGNLPPEELARNLAITRGTETGLGDVIGSPFLKKRLENTLTSMPFSGANESLQRTGQEVVNRGEKILDRMLGTNDPNQVPKIIHEDLNTQFLKNRTLKENLYNESNQIADDIGLKLELPRFSEKAKKYSHAIESTNMLKYEPDSATIFNKLQNYKEPVKTTTKTGLLQNKEGEPLLHETISEYPTLKEANIMAGRLNDYANRIKHDPDSSKRNMVGVFKSLSNDLKSDIKDAIENSESKELKDSFNLAQENYKKNYSKFLDEDIYDFIGGNANAEEIINKFVKTKPTADLAGSISNLSKVLSPQTQPLIGYSYLSRALDNEGNLNPTKLATAIEKLKPNQFKALFPDQNIRRELKDYSRLQHMNKEAQNLMFNPKTGQRTTDVLMTGLLGALGHLGSGNIAGALLAPGAAIVGGRAATKALTSESLRESLIKEILKNRTKYTKRTRAVQAGAQGAKKQLSEGNEE